MKRWVATNIVLGGLAVFGSLAASRPASATQVNVPAGPGLPRAIVVDVLMNYDCVLGKTGPELVGKAYGSELFNGNNIGNFQAVLKQGSKQLSDFDLNYAHYATAPMLQQIHAPFIANADRLCKTVGPQSFAAAKLQLPDQKQPDPPGTFLPRSGRDSDIPFTAYQPGSAPN